MDPYLEDEALWPDFHRQLLAVLHQVLLPSFPAQRYLVVAGSRQYTADTSQGTPDHHENYLEIRGGDGDGRLVTLVDLVSPANKQTTAGRQAYLEQRRQARESLANVVEIDLVLRGQPTLDYSRENLPDWDYAVTVTRAPPSERHEIYCSTLQKRLPRFRLPLAADDRDTALDLQTAFSRCYQEGNFGGRIDYGRDPSVPLDEEARRWLDTLLTQQGLRGPPPPHDQVAALAYALWEQEGRPHGRDREHWHRALERLRREKGVGPGGGGG
jgi:hypothetical protein